MIVTNIVMLADNHRQNPSQGYMNVHSVVNMFVVIVVVALVHFVLIVKKPKMEEWWMTSSRQGLIIRLVAAADFFCLAWGLRPQMSTRLSKRQKRGEKRSKKGATPYKYYLERDEIIRRKINDRCIKDRA